MTGKIIALLKKLEQQERIRILYACEHKGKSYVTHSSGYACNIRFIFIRPLEDQLSIYARADSIFQVAGHLHFYGLDLRKALQSVHLSDATLYEWMASTSIYLEDRSFAASLRLLLPLYFSPKICSDHYYYTAKSCFERGCTGSIVHVYTYFATLYNLLACYWIITKGSMHPATFHLLRPLIEVSPVQSIVDDLLEVQKSSGSVSVIVASGPLNEWIRHKLSVCIAMKSPMKAIPRDTSALNVFYREVISGYGVEAHRVLYLN